MFQTLKFSPQRIRCTVMGDRTVPNGKEVALLVINCIWVAFTVIT